MKLQRPTRARVVFDGTDLGGLERGERRRMRRRLQIVWQDAAASLDPRMPLGDTLHQALDIHGLAKGSARSRRIHQLLDLAGLPASFLERYPHQLSGGQAQRVAICRALVVGPELLVCDQPLSALGVSIQAQIVNLLQDLKRELGLTYLFISDDLSIVRHISDVVAVMYLGQIVEYAPKDELYRRPLHPYTQALLSAVPVSDPMLERARRRTIPVGDLPDPADPPSGCVFRTRCPIAIEACGKAPPPRSRISPEHWVRCIRLDQTKTTEDIVP